MLKLNLWWLDSMGILTLVYLFIYFDNRELITAQRDTFLWDFTMLLYTIELLSSLFMPCLLLSSSLLLKLFS